MKDLLTLIMEGYVTGATSEISVRGLSVEWIMNQLSRRSTMSESLTNRTHHFQDRWLTVLVRRMAEYVVSLGDRYEETGQVYMDGYNEWHSSIVRKTKLPSCPCAYEGFCGCTCKGHECHRGLPNEASCGI